MQRLKDLVRGKLLRCGISATRAETSGNADALAITLLKQSGGNLVIDVGAHEGEFALQILRGHHKIPVLSFEPIPEVFAGLKQSAGRLQRWQVRNLALGNETRETEINISANRTASSLLTPTSTGLNHSGFETVERVKIKVERLEDVLSREYTQLEDKRIYLKLDVQGFELSVLQGIGKLLDRIVACQIELSLVELYQNQPSAYEVYTWLLKHGFLLYAVSNTLRDTDTGSLQQVDGFFIRNPQASVSK
jgi:FkbM family methyltransferase